MTIEVMGESETHDIIKLNEFSSERKMMSVVAKNRENGETVVYAKGASDMMATHLLPSNGSSDLMLANKFATEGLRVLSFSVRKDNELCAESQTASIENDLSLVGITAVEDLLQDDVAKCI